MMDSIYWAECLLLLLLGLISGSISTEIGNEYILDKLDRLEARVLHQELQLQLANDEIISLRERVQLVESLLIDKIEKKSQSVSLPINRSAVFSPRTCQEARDSGLPEFQASGMYWIDPDGLGIGDGAIYVHCNMTTGSTSIGHDSESKIPIPKCNDPGCFSSLITYQNVTDRQIKALADISADCHQSLQVDCFGGPFTIEDIDYAWWNDVDGNKQTFWSGSDVTTHTCQCGIDDNCVRPDLKCNCDANVAIPLSDDGMITLKQVLPIKKLNFGKINHDGGSHTLGKLVCSGTSKPAEKYPTSCRDLWRMGHALNGFYPIRGDKRVRLVYCDFTTGQNVLDDDIGFVDVKTKSVQFYVQRETSFVRPAVNAAMPFEISIINEGSAMEMTTGIFTAPISGTYFFDFSAVGSSERTGAFSVIFYVNGNKNASAVFDDVGQLSSSMPSVWHLTAGSQVKLSTSTSTGTIYSDNKFGPLTHFAGFLIEEDIFPQ